MALQASSADSTIIPDGDESDEEEATSLVPGTGGAGCVRKERAAKRHSSGVRAANDARRRPVIGRDPKTHETIKSYESLTAAAFSIGVPKSTLAMYIKDQRLFTVPGDSSPLSWDYSDQLANADSNERCRQSFHGAALHKDEAVGGGVAKKMRTSGGVGRTSEDCRRDGPSMGHGVLVSIGVDIGHWGTVSFGYVCACFNICVLYDFLMCVLAISSRFKYRLPSEAYLSVYSGIRLEL